MLLMASCRSERDLAAERLDERGVLISPSSLLIAMQEGRTADVDDILTAGIEQLDPNDVSRQNLVASAILHGRSDVANALIENGASVHRGEPSVLAVAIAKGALDTARLAMEKGATPDGLSLTGENLLPWTITQGHYAAAHLLLDYGARVNARDARGQSAVMLAIAAKRPKLLVRLLQDGSEMDGTHRATQRLGPLAWAVENAHPEIIDMLLEAGADPSEVDLMGRPLIFRAIQEGNLPLARSFIAAGADVDARYEGARAIDHAFVARDRNLIRELLMLGASAQSALPDGSTPLALALADRDYDLAFRLLRFGAPVRHELNAVAERGDIIGARILLDHGANRLGATPPLREPPLFAAMFAGRERMAEHLIEAGADLGVRPAGAQSLFHLAVVRCDKQLVRRLLEAGADPNEKFETPVSADLIAQLPFDGFSYFLRRDRRITPLMLAAASGDVEFAQLLLDHGAKIGRKAGRSGLWTINFASRRNDVPMMRLLLGADPHDTSRKIVVDLSEQRARVYENGKMIFSTRVSTGKKGYRTRRGTFAITNKYRHWTSTIYGSSMPHFQRFSCSDFGFHAGYVPGYAASHGCIRVPAGNARKLFALTELGDRVIIQR